MQRLMSYVCGEWRDGTGSVELVNPATEEVIATAPKATPNLLEAAKAAREVGGPALRAMTFAERGALLKRMSTALHEARERLIDLSMQNSGATRGDAKFDVDGGIGTLAYYARLGEQLGDRRFLVEGPGETLTRAPRFAGYHVKMARPGVAVHINAFNFPVWGMAEKAACALLAGMPVITKPATSTAWVAHEAVKLLVESKTVALPSGALQLVVGGMDDILQGLQPEDVLAFTGSADTAAKLRRLPAVIERSVRINVEADSLNSAVLGVDVEKGSETWHLFLKHVVTEMTQKTGQKCTATRRIMVPKHLAADVKEALKERLSAVRLGNPQADGVDMGPLATRQQFEDAKKGLGLLVQDGCEVLTGAKPVEGKGFFLPPTLLWCENPAKAKAVHNHEVFAPVSTMMPYQTAKDVAQLVARGEGSLVASLYSDDKAFLEEVITHAAPWSGRLLIGSEKIADMSTTPGMVLPSCVHGGPGRAGGGEELGGERGLSFYMQRTAVQGDRGLLDRLLGAPKADGASAG